MSRNQRPPQRMPTPSSPSSIGARISNETAMRLASTSHPRSTFRATLRTHTDDIAADKLVAAMKPRFAQLRETGLDWEDPRKISPELLAGMLGEAICTGDAVLVGVIAAMILSRDGNQQTIAEHAMRAFLRGSCHDQAQHIAQLQTEVAQLRDASPETRA